MKVEGTGSSTRFSNIGVSEVQVERSGPLMLWSYFSTPTWVYNLFPSLSESRIEHLLCLFVSNFQQKSMHTFNDIHIGIADVGEGQPICAISNRIKACNSFSNHF
ncbi:hypothetical protein WUBG_04018 [Wuchereria bancrofti]|uniref:Uncharacterized protein n=1 Tax=Wuchereria bancrofti TaxID=6293 RepID=J9ERD6_WUCBA|nr:hypothetical protein WUBG_04018 [Wuchereria bancrofti]